MANIDHGCFRKNVDGTSRIIANDKKCLVLRHEYFGNILKIYLLV